MNERLTQLETWLLKRGYLHKNVRFEIERVNLTSREDLFKESEKKVDESAILVLTFHPAMNCVHRIPREAHCHVLKSNRLSKLKPKSDVTTGNFDCGSKRCEICKILVPGNEFKSFVTKKSYKMSFLFACLVQYVDVSIRIPGLPGLEKGLISTSRT